MFLIYKSFFNLQRREMLSYTILDRENIPDVLKENPRVVACAIIVATVVAITATAVAAGAFIGYTYCYLEHRHTIATGPLLPGNLTHSTNFQIVHMPYVADTPAAKRNRTINSALSSVLVSRILKFGHSLLDEELTNVPWTEDVLELVQSPR